MYFNLCLSTLCKVAFKAINNGPLKLVAFYHDGKHIAENAEKRMEELIQTD